MKHTDEFERFLSEVVNINSTRLNTLKASVTAIENFVRDSDWEPEIIEFFPQGSWAHKTIIKPPKTKAYDADLVVYVEPIEDWEARQYLDSLYNIFKGNNVYREKIGRYSHCLTLTYAGKRNLDIACCVMFADETKICNRSGNTFEQTAPKKYTDWVNKKNSHSGNDRLREVTRLVKYLRDIKTTFSCESVLLTTLLGNNIYTTDNLLQNFQDVPSALKIVIERLDNWLQENPDRPQVSNPVLESESLGELWTEEKYKNFRTKIHDYRGWIDEAYSETDENESLGKWRRVFGEDFAKRVTVEKALAVSSAHVTRHDSIQSVSSDLVSLVKQYGVAVIPPELSRLPHKERPKWKTAKTLFRVEVSAFLHQHRDSKRLRAVSSGDSVSKNQWLEFCAYSPTASLQKLHHVRWRVTNTGSEAARANCLRGNFVRENSQVYHWEGLSYRGVHTVEAFVLDQSNQIVAVSEPFFVTIE